MITNACEDIEDLALMRRRVTDAVGGQQRQMKAFGKRDGLLIDGFFLPVVVALKFNVDIGAAEDVDQPLECVGTVFIGNGAGQGTVLAAREADQSSRV